MVKVKWEAKGLRSKQQFSKQIWVPEVTESSFVYSMSLHYIVLYTYMMNQQMHMYKHVQSYIIIIHQKCFTHSGDSAKRQMY
jgi:hypothetical protein